MAVDFRAVRKIVGQFPGTIEGTSYGTPAFYVSNKMYVRIRDDEEFLVIRCAIDDRDALIERHPESFSVTDHYVKYPYVLAHICQVSPKQYCVQCWRSRGGALQENATWMTGSAVLDECDSQRADSAHFVKNGLFGA